MSQAVPDDWPRVEIGAACRTCGEFLFGEAYRPALLDRWDLVTAFWRLVLERHLTECPRARSREAP